MPVILPGLLVCGVFALLMFLPFGGFDSAASISQAILNLIDSALVVALVSIFAFSLRYFRARGFYFLVLLFVQLWYLQQGPDNPDGIFWTLIFVPYSFTLFLIIPERGLFSPRTRVLLVFILVPVLARFLFEQYLNFPLIDFLRVFPLQDQLTSRVADFSLWSLIFYILAGVLAMVRYILKPSRDLSAVIWIIALSVGMIFIASAGEFPSVVRAGLSSEGGTPQYMFMASRGVDPGLHTMLALVVFAAAIIEVVTLFDVSYRMAYQDQLTGLPGRRAFDQASSNLGKKYALAMVDIDHFKSFNDTYGHDVGDQVLKLVAQVLKNNSAPGTAYRYGGEEFVILYPGASAAEVAESAESVRSKIGKYPFALRKFLRPHFPPRKADGKASKSPKTRKKSSSKAGSRGGRGKSAAGTSAIPKTVHVTVSMGLADHRKNDLNAEEVMKLADQALYRAKEGGRNRLEIENGN